MDYHPGGTSPPIWSREMTRRAQRLAAGAAAALFWFPCAGGAARHLHAATAVIRTRNPVRSACASTESQTGWDAQATNPRRRDVVATAGNCASVGERPSPGTSRHADTVGGAGPSPSGDCVE